MLQGAARIVDQTLAKNTPFEYPLYVHEEEMTAAVQRLLRKLYTTAGGPAYLSSPEVLYLHAKELNKDVTYADVAKFIKKSHTYSVTRQASKKVKQYLPYATTKSNQVWHLDLMFNQQKPYLVTVDVFNGRIMVRKMPNKQPESTVKALSYIVTHMNDSIYPSKIYTDRGMPVFLSEIAN